MAGTAPLGIAGGLRTPCWPRMTPPEVVWNQASTESGCVLVEPLAGYGITLLGSVTNWLVPLKLKACPTLPAAKMTPFCNMPLLTPKKSPAVPSPVYQAPIPDG